MEAASGQGRTLRATLCEIECGVFYATYQPGPDTDNLPSYQVGKSADDAKQKIERRAKALGFAAVTWRESIMVPSFAAQSNRRDKPASYVARRGA